MSISYGLSYNQMKEEIEEVMIKNNMLSSQPHMGDSVNTAFNYNNLKDDLRDEFSNDNWNDFIVSDIRDISSELKINGYGDGFTSTDIGDVLISQTYTEDTTYTFFNVCYMCEETGDVYNEVYMMRYYKDRGRTEEFVNLTVMRNITLYELLNLRNLLKDK